MVMLSSRLPIRKFQVPEISPKMTIPYRRICMDHKSCTERYGRGTDATTKQRDRIGSDIDTEPEDLYTETDQSSGNTEAIRIRKAKKLKRTQKRRRDIESWPRDLPRGVRTVVEAELVQNVLGGHGLTAFMRLAEQERAVLLRLSLKRPGWMKRSGFENMDNHDLPRFSLASQTLIEYGAEENIRNDDLLREARAAYHSMNAFHLAGNRLLGFRREAGARRNTRRLWVRFFTENHAATIQMFVDMLWTLTKYTRLKWVIVDVERGQERWQKQENGSCFDSSGDGMKQSVDDYVRCLQRAVEMVASRCSFGVMMRKAIKYDSKDKAIQHEVIKGRWEDRSSELLEELRRREQADIEECERIRWKQELVE